MTVPPPNVIAEVVSTAFRVPAHANGIRVVAIDGPSGSGKTSLAGALARRTDAHVVHMDDLYPGWDGLEKSVGRLVDWLLRPLADGGRAGYHRWDWEHDEYAEWHDVGAAPLVVLEGAGCGSAAARPFLSLLVWLDAPEAIRRERAIARDGDGYRPHWERWAEQERRLFERDGTRAAADLVFEVSAAPDDDGAAGQSRSTSANARPPASEA